MFCGMYEQDITPPLGKNLPGYFQARPASGIRDRLMAKAMAFTDDGGSTFVLISVDAIVVDSEMAEKTRSRIHELTGLAPERVMMAATHSHTAGPLDNFVPGTRDQAYVDFLCERAADAAVMALNARQPVKLGYGSAQENSIAFIRRYYMKDGTFKTNPGFDHDAIERPAGEIDPEVSVVKIEDLNGKLLGVITNYACHLDTVGGNSYCADYPGELSRVLKSVYGQEVVSLFLTGACGNINHYDYMHRTLAYYRQANPPHYIRMGRILAGDVIRALADIETKEGGSVAVANDSFTGYIRIPTAEDVAGAEAFLEKYPYVHVVSREGVEERLPEKFIDRHYARALLAVAAMEQKELIVPVQVAKVGDVAIAGMPCELFVEFGLDVKKRSGFEHTLISTLTNSHFGYLATRESFEQGGYETTISGDTMMGPETGYDLAETAVRLCRTVKSACGR